MAEGAMTAFLTDVGTFFTQSIAWLGDALDVVVSNPALLVVCLGMPIAGFAVGLLNRMMKL